MKEPVQALIWQRSKLHQFIVPPETLWLSSGVRAGDLRPQEHLM